MGLVESHFSISPKFLDLILSCLIDKKMEGTEGKEWKGIDGRSSCSSSTDFDDEIFQILKVV